MASSSPRRQAAMAREMESLHDPDPKVRQEAAEALGRARAPRAVEPLIRCLRDRSSSVRRAAAEALGEIRDLRAVEPLVRRLPDKGGRVREATVEALRRMGEPAVEALICCVDDCEWGWERGLDWHHQEAAAKALEEIKDPRAVEPLVRRLAEWLSKGKAQAATEALAGFGEPAVEPLSRCVWSMEAAETGARVLAKIRDPLAVGALVRCLENPNTGVRFGAAEALGVISDARAVEPLIRRLEDEERCVRSMAAKALVAIGDRRGLGAVARAREPGLLD